LTISPKKEIMRLGKWPPQELDRLIRDAALIPDPGMRVSAISREFLNTPYQGLTLEGGPGRKETLVVNLEGVDCFTFIDYVEAMRISASFTGFRESLIRVRYALGRVSYARRNHFFSDWLESAFRLVRDMTAHVGRAASRRAEKVLNLKEDGGFWLPGIPARKREIPYIPAEFVDDFMESLMKTGDYVGIYTEAAGLDVSHVGIFVRNGKGSCLRHASSADETRKVVDQDFRTYVAARPGIVIYRPEPPRQAREGMHE
jgi:hypothetical protein